MQIQHRMSNLPVQMLLEFFFFLSRYRTYSCAGGHRPAAVLCDLGRCGAAGGAGSGQPAPGVPAGGSRPLTRASWGLVRSRQAHHVQVPLILSSYLVPVLYHTGPAGLRIRSIFGRIRIHQIRILKPDPAPDPGSYWHLPRINSNI